MNPFLRKKLIRPITLLSLIFTVFLAEYCYAQLNPLASQYFQNQYLANPALAGINGGLTLNGALRQQWSNIPGSPVTQALTADYRLKNKVGLGLNMYNENAGLIQRTRMVGSYAYHLPLTEKQQLHFGVSLGFMNQRLMQEQINGDQGDELVDQFNLRETYIDGDFGMAYTDDRLNVQAAIPNMKSFFGSDDNKVVDKSTFYSAVSYRWFFGTGLSSVTLEPKVVFRGVKGYDHLVDAGTNISMVNNQLIFTGLYHSSKSATLGIGLNYKKALSILGMYTTETAALRGLSSGNYEIGLRYRFEN